MPEPTTRGRQTIARHWSEYAEKVLPVHAPPVQTQETKRAFYAGATAMLAAIMTGLTPDREPTDEDEAHLERLDAELRQFGRDVKAGRA